MMDISKQDVYDAEDAWTDACEEHGPDSTEATEAWENYQEMSKAHQEQMELREQMEAY